VLTPYSKSTKLPSGQRAGTELFPCNDRAWVFWKDGQKAEGLVLKLYERAFPPELTGRKVGFKDTESDDSR
jgi:hypothetical protein